MDCEKFDQILIDALYDELDELTLAAAKRHADGCQHCQAAWSGLKATRKIGILPLVEAPAGLDARIMTAAREAHRNVPWPKRIGRAISWAGGYAMRPQMAMAAVLVLMLGSSVLVLRAKPDRSGAGPSRVSVTERGVPEQAAEELHPDKDLALDGRLTAPGRLARRDEDRAAASAAPFAAPPPAVAMREGPSGSDEAKKGFDKSEASEARPRSVTAPTDDLALNGPAEIGGLEKEKKRDQMQSGAGAAAPAATAAAEPTQQKDAFGAAMDLYQQGRYAEAEKAFKAVEASGSKNASSAALFAAKSSEASLGCTTAASKYEAVSARYPNSNAGFEAMYGAANCYKEIGEVERAQKLYITLRNVAGYRDRAESALADLRLAQRQAPAKATRAAPAAKQAPPAAAPASPPQQASPKSNSF
jgi:TolA-binding protein